MVSCLLGGIGVLEFDLCVSQVDFQKYVGLRF